MGTFAPVVFFVASSWCRIWVANGFFVTWMPLLPPRPANTSVSPRIDGGHHSSGAREYRRFPWPGRRQHRPPRRGSEPGRQKLYDAALPHDETKMRYINTNLSGHGNVLVVVDQPASIGALPAPVTATPEQPWVICSGWRCAGSRTCTPARQRPMSRQTSHRRHVHRPG